MDEELVVKDAHSSAVKAVIEKKDRTVTAEVVTLNSNDYVIGVEIELKNDNTTLPILYHRLSSDDGRKMTGDFSKNIKTFTGTFTIEAEGEVLRKHRVQNGKIVSSQYFDQKLSDYECTMKGIVTCADDEINDMNAVEYLFCAASAPACLAETYASCLYENC